MKLSNRVKMQNFLLSDRASRRCVNWNYSARMPKGKCTSRAFIFRVNTT